MTRRTLMCTSRVRECFPTRASTMFELLQAPEPDEIYEVARQFSDDTRAEKINLGIGIYQNGAGRTPIFDAVKRAEQLLLDTETTKAYLGLAGDEVFNLRMVELALGKRSLGGRLSSIQAPGGSGALRLLMELVARANPAATVWLPTPTWPNHPSIARQTRLAIETYPYFDPMTRGVDFDALRAAISRAGPRDVVLLHGCCHNPTGADLRSTDEWRELAKMSESQGFIPLIDLAYQGFGDGLDQDATGLRIMADHRSELLVAISCSKTFGLYRERTGCAIVICPGNNDQTNISRNMMALGRANYSTPPSHGAAIVRVILEDDELRLNWEAELGQMRNRLRELRKRLLMSLRSRGESSQHDFITSHRGMFSILGATNEQVERLRDQFAIYVTAGGRINVAGLREDKIDIIADALVAVGL